VKCGNGPRYQNARASEKNLPVWLYDAQVPNWDGCAGQPANIDPYERPNPTFIDPATDNCGGGDTTYTQPGGPWYGNCFLDDVATACGPTTTPASGTGQEVFDLANPAPVMWYQPQTLTAVTVASGGSGYEVGDTLGLNGGAISSFSPPYWESFDNNASLLVTAVDGSGAITALSIAGAGSYKTNPSSPNAVTGGHGHGASITLTWKNQTMDF
jgi:hypothetical protein